MSSLTIESQYVDLSIKSETDGWESLPLSELRKIYTSDAQQKFLQEEIIDRSLPSE